MTKLARCLMLLVGFTLLAGCVSPVSVESSRSAHFAGLNDFAWLKPGKTPLKNPIVDSGIVAHRIKQAVIEALRNRGFSYRKHRSQAQFLVTDHLISHREMVTNPPFFYGYGFYGAPFFPYYDDDGFFGPGPFGFGSFGAYGSYGYGYSYQVAVLVIDIIDAKTHRLIWRGWISRQVRQSNFSPAAIYRAVNRILGHFPPR
jgi:hypothetical protein